MKKRVLIRGPALVNCGYGEHARFALRALRSRPDLFDIFVVPTNWGNCSWQHEDTEERRFIDKCIVKHVENVNKDKIPYDIALHVTIPNEFERMAPLTIGVTAGIETTKVSPQWLDKARVVDRMVVVSQHAKDVFEKTSYQVQDQNGQPFNLKCNTPIDVVGYPVKNLEPITPNIEFKHDFNFLAVAQWGPRKNMENLVHWFMQEFKNDDIGLVLKTSIQNNSTTDYYKTKEALETLLKPYSNHKCSVQLIHGSMSDEEMHGLYLHPKIKALVSTSHGEGFGLPLFEAAYSGLPVVCVSWSGQYDFLFAPKTDKNGKTKIKPMFATVDYDLKQIPQYAVWDGVLQADSMWAYPRESSFKSRLREVYKDYNRFKSQAKNLKDHLVSEFEEQKMYDKFVKTVLGSDYIDKFDNSVLPKISIITSVYNGDDYIDGFLKDITSQTIFDKCELLLIDCNSPGNEYEAIKPYLERYPNIIYKRLGSDPGIYGAWNLGVNMASGEYLTNANLDDRKAPWSIERHARELYLNPEIDLVYADSKVSHLPNETWENNTCKNKMYNFPEFSFENLKMVNMPHNNPMWRKSLHDKYGIFDDKYKSAGDWEMWLRAASKGSKFKKIKELLGIYYHNPKGISTNPDNFEWKQKEEQEIYKKYADIEIDQ